jgi:hypothetical protein
MVNSNPNTFPTTVIRRPGGELSTRPLHFIWICDNYCRRSLAELIEAQKETDRRFKESQK